MGRCDRERDLAVAVGVYVLNSWARAQLPDRQARRTVGRMRLALIGANEFLGLGGGSPV